MANYYKCPVNTVIHSNKEDWILWQALSECAQFYQYEGQTILLELRGRSSASISMNKV